MNGQKLNNNLFNQQKKVDATPEFNHYDNTGYPIFNFAKQHFGGTETMARYFHNNIFEKLPKLKEYQCLILPGTLSEDFLKNPLPIILWVHNTVEQFGPNLVNLFKNPTFQSKIKHIVTVSEFHKQDVIKATGIPEQMVSVVSNGINPINFNKDKFNNIEKIKLIHTSDPTRGLGILVKSLSYIEEDFDLEIYNDFDPDKELNTNTEFYKLCMDERITFFGKTPKKIVNSAIENAHIHAYPSIFLETFCLSQAEAMSGGLLSVYSNYGSLPEISNNFGISYDIPTNEEHPFLFAQKLKNAIEIIKNKQWEPSEQINFINNRYSWNSVTKEWENFHNKL